MKKYGLRLSLSLGLSVLFLYLAFRHVDVDQVGATLRRVDGTYVALYTLTLVVIQLCRSLRWEVLVRPFAPLSQRAAFRVSNVGNMLVMLLPLRLGEFSRPVLMRDMVGAKFASTMGAVLVERILDGLLVSLMFFATLRFIGPPYVVAPQLRYGALVALLVFGGASVGVAAALWAHGPLVRLLGGGGSSLWGRLGGRWVGLLDAFVAGLRALPNARALAALALWTLAYWFANGIGLWWLSRAFGWQLPAVSGFVLVCVLVIFIMVPAGPGFLGPYQAAMVAGLNVFGITDSQAMAYGVVAYAVNLAVVVGFGLPYLLGRRGVRVAAIVREADRAPAPPPTAS